MNQATVFNRINNPFATTPSPIDHGRAFEVEEKTFAAIDPVATACREQAKEDCEAERNTPNKNRPGGRT